MCNCGYFMILYMDIHIAYTYTHTSEGCMCAIKKQVIYQYVMVNLDDSMCVHASKMSLRAVSLRILCPVPLNWWAEVECYGGELAWLCWS